VITGNALTCGFTGLYRSLPVIVVTLIYWSTVFYFLELVVKPLTHSQNRILAYLMSVGGNENAGSTVKEIISATGVSPNTVYTHLRNGLPGVVKCKHRNVNNAEMFYVTTHTIAEGFTPAKAETINPAPVEHTIAQSKEWAKPLSFPEIAAGYTETLNKPHSLERLEELVRSAEIQLAHYKTDPKKGYLTMVAIAMQVAAIIALEEAGK